MAKGDQINPAQSQTPMWQQIASQNPSYPQSIVQQPPMANMRSPMMPMNNSNFSMMNLPHMQMQQMNPFMNQVQGIMRGFGNPMQSQMMPQQNYFNQMRAGQFYPGNGISGPQFLGNRMGMNYGMRAPMPMMRSMMPINQAIQSMGIQPTQQANQNYGGSNSDNNSDNTGKQA